MMKFFDGVLMWLVIILLVVFGVCLVVLFIVAVVVWLIMAIILSPILLLVWGVAKLSRKPTKVA